MSPDAVSSVPVQTRVKAEPVDDVCAAARSTLSCTQISRTIAWHNNFDGCLTCSGEERRDTTVRRGERMSSRAEPSRATDLHCGWKDLYSPRPGTELQSASVFLFFSLSTPIKDSEIQTSPLYIKLYHTVSSSSPWQLIWASCCMHALCWPECFMEAMFCTRKSFCIS